MAALTWVTSAGGPLIVVPDVLRSLWQGVDEDSFDTYDSFEDWGDYGRACAATSGSSAQSRNVALIPVGGAHALVLGDGHASTTFLPERRLFIQYAPDGPETEFLEGLDQALAEVRWADGDLFWTVPGPCTLFDAAWPGDETDEHLRVDIPAGRYCVRVADAGHIFIRLDTPPSPAR
ncbi:Imm21 family immunity protein [Embleya sp. NPDC001921]